MVTSVTVDSPSSATTDPGWLLVWDGFEPLRERDVESSMTIGNGYFGTRGSVEEGSRVSVPGTLIAGVYAAVPETGQIPELVVAPNWLLFTVWVEGEKLSLDSGHILMHRRTLDMRRGILVRDWLHQDRNGRQTSFRSLRFASLADRHAAGMQVWVTPQNYSGRIRVESGIDGDVANADGPVTGGRLKYLTPLISQARNGSGIVFAMQTKETRPRFSAITIAMAATTSIGTGGSETLDPAAKRGVETSSLKAVETLEWDARIGVTYQLDKLVSMWTSRDEGSGRASMSNVLASKILASKVLAMPGGDGSGEHTAPLAALPEGLGPLGQLAVQNAATHVDRLESAGVGSVESNSNAAWEGVWHDAEVEIDRAVWAQHAIRFAMYHLIIAANPEDEHVSISARTLSGPAYKGHVFWDTEIFMLPFFVFTNPRAARSLLMYRYWTLSGARGKARAHGYRGALYAWESADLGTEATPPEVALPTGGVIKILSGMEEQHISADIPYAVWQYWRATADDDFVKDYGAEIVLECARFWSSRVEEGQDGKFHIRNVIGPDEYHESVDDDAFTNAMAAWTLEFALQVTDWMRGSDRGSWTKLARRIRHEESEEERWREIARLMYTGLDEQTGLIEQFQGFFKLEQIDLTAFEQRVAPMDILLGRERIQRSQVVKQADVLMLFHLLPDRYPKEIMDKNFQYYGPRTGHGSSLSPATHAIVAARLGYTSSALGLFKLAAAIDLGNAMGNSSGGIHGASCGGLWQAVLLGFAGMRLGETQISFDPNLPPEWPGLRANLIYRGQPLIVRIEGEKIEISTESAGQPVRIAIGPADGFVSRERPLVASRQTGTWRLTDDGEKGPASAG
jgi:kojibiose phosphorylase